MDVYKDFAGHVRAALAALAADGVLPAGLETGAVTVEPPRDPAHGDLATNAALVLAKPAGMRPRDLAAAIAERLAAVEGVASVDIAGPGFLNLRLDDDVWQRVLAAILAADTDYGRGDIGGGRKINVEYVSANPTGPLHVGHSRGAVFGDALAALLEHVGFAVTREYYVNDAGAQLQALARSVHYRYREALGVAPAAPPEGFYPGDYLIPVGEELARIDGDKWLNGNEKDWGDRCAEFGRDAMMRLIEVDLAALGIEIDRFTFERRLHGEGEVQAAFDRLAAKGLIYRGVLEPPKGKAAEDWEPREQDLFRSTRFGDDVDRALKKSDGSWTYFAADIAYHLDKLERGFTDMIDVWGADHGGYVKRVKAAVAALSDGQATLDVKICQMVNLLDGGKPVKMSKRAGTFVTLREVVEAVGKDVVRFIMLTRRNDAPLDFDYARVTEKSRDNPVFYVQYAHARICSVERNAALAEGKADLSLLTEPDELALIRTLAGWPRLLETAAAAHEPHRLAFALYDLAAAFHALWNKGNDDPGLRFLIADKPELSRARLALLRGVKLVIASGLGIIGVTPVEEMR